MSTPYVGEIRMFAGNFAPSGWMFCSGQVLPISEFQTLFALIGTTYGGDGQSTFALPNMQGSIPVHQGTGFVPGQAGGTETVTLTPQQIPSHTHPIVASPNPGHVSDPTGAHIGADRDFAAFSAGSDAANGGFAAMNTQTLLNTGGSQPHNNVPPYLCVSFIISLFGIFPTQN